jgi:hypothetical protein
MIAYKERIMLFSSKMKKAVGIMEEQKRQLKGMSVIRDKQDTAQSKLLNDLMKYEDVGIAYFAD